MFDSIGIFIPQSREGALSARNNNPLIIRHSREGGNPGRLLQPERIWQHLFINGLISNIFGSADIFLDSRLRGNDE